MYETDNGKGPPAGPGYRLPQDGPLPDLLPEQDWLALEDGC